LLSPLYVGFYGNTVCTAVTGEANFSMARTSLTVGGFNQPAIARALIELPNNQTTGLSQRFLWLFPKPVYGKFSTLEPVDKSFTDKIGKYGYTLYLGEGGSF
jgi:hypothetical protein